MHPMLYPNNVKVAVKRVGGPTRCALLMECSGTTIHSWIRQRKISNITKAQKLADLAGMKLQELRPCP